MSLTLFYKTNDVVTFDLIDKILLILLVPVVARTLLEMEHVIVQQNAGTNLVKQREDVQQGKLTNKT